MNNKYGSKGQGSNMLLSCALRKADAPNLGNLGNSCSLQL